MSTDWPEPLKAALAGCVEAIAGDADGATLALTLEELANAFQAAECLALHDACVLFGEMAADIGSSPQTRRDLLAPWPRLLADYLESAGDERAAKALVDHLCRDAWSTPLGAEDAEMLLTLLATPGGPGDDNVSEAGASAEQDAPAPEAHERGERSRDEITPEICELLALLDTELDQILELLVESLAQHGREDGADILKHAAEQLERFASAAEATGLSGVQVACDFVGRNIVRLDTGSDGASDSTLAAIESWGEGLHLYLRSPTDPQARAALLDACRATQWPSPLGEEQLEALSQSLANPSFELEEESQAPPRPTTATDGDISLRLPEDADPELLESLLQELPSQTEEFTQAVQGLLDAGDPSNVETAQRVVHTIKGAANTVGVSGLANIAHHLEDILSALGKERKLPGPGLAELMVEAADCLETMTEALTGTGPPPANGLSVLQTILDWANRIDDEGSVPETVPPRRDAQPESPAPAPSSEAPVATPMLRVPASLIDNLLRLVGETLILTGQVQERVRRTWRDTRAMREQFNQLQQLGYELEQQVDLKDLSTPRLRLVKDDEFDPLEFDRYNELHTISRRLVEAAVDARELSRDVEKELSRLETLLVDQGRLNRETHERMMETRMMPVKTITPRLQRSVRQAARQLDKAVELAIQGAETLLDSDVLSDLVDPLMHLLRNAVDHGIEDREQRLASGKPVPGRIELTFAREGNQVLIRCRDDGAGIDFAAIRAKAVELGVFTPEQDVSEDELRRLILEPNFSTRSEATQVSGRGIGLDAVRSRVLELGGFIEIQSGSEAGCVAELRLPLSLRSTHALIVRVRQHVMALANRGIEQILHPGAGEVVAHEDGRGYRLIDTVYPALLLENLVGLPMDDREADREPRTALLIESETGTKAVLVQKVLASRDVVVKSISRHLPKLPGIAGATILGDGTVSPVLELAELMRQDLTASGRLARAIPKRTALERTKPVALVVDDSLSARRSLARFMEDSGYEVRTARDGVEAVDILAATRPDVLLVDLEMPRMDGLELASHVRGRSETSGVPIIMITSRSTAKHRNQATSVGVNAYLTKPFSGDELGDCLQKLQSELETA